ncbi:MAG TPA: CBS domain-containing protein, partial [Kofleriaceae bacterium]|nr:CBS domain-containing protein [Kofleriaceae bacterium]
MATEDEPAQADEPVAGAAPEETNDETNGEANGDANGDANGRHADARGDAGADTRGGASQPDEPGGGADDRHADEPNTPRPELTGGPLPRDATPLPGIPLELTPLDPAEARAAAAEIRGIAEQRAEEPDADAEAVTVQLPTPATAEGDGLSVDDLRDAWDVLDIAERLDGFRLLPREDAEDFFMTLPAADQVQIVLAVRPGDQRGWLRLLEPDDVADVVQEAPEDQRARLLGLLDGPTRKEVEALLAYEEDEAGGLMNPRYARLRPQMTADEAISYLRRQARSRLETIYYAYVLDHEQKLLGVVSFRDLFRAPPKRVVSEIMETEVVCADEELDQEALSRLFAEHDLTVVPIVDANRVMKGIVTVDDIVDVVQEEATEDAQKFGGMEVLDLPYLQSRRREMIAKRGRWLVILLVGEMLTATAMGFFQKDIERAAVLSLFIPLIISSGGNAGSQSSTL